VRAAHLTPDTLQLDHDHLASLAGPRTRLIAVGGASNAVGTINDLERVAAIARSTGALLFVDAVHLAPHELIDVQRIGCDFLSCSAYKFYGPHLGLLYARQDLLEALPFPKLDPAPDSAPERAETGTQNHEGIAGTGATIDFLASIGGAIGSRRDRLARSYAVLHERGARLTRMLWDGLSSIRGVRVYGPKPDQPRTPTIAFTVAGVGAEEVCRRLAGRAIFASHGNFYAATVTERLGVDALVRVGCACYTTEQEVARVVRAVEEIAASRT
jgi:selenocysteine lyase/cysteine desulfurase